MSPWAAKGGEPAMGNPIGRTGSGSSIEDSPEPGPPITVGMDGGYIRGRERRSGGTALADGTRFPWSLKMPNEQRENPQGT
jgi:hypothetical protein